MPEQALLATGSPLPQGRQTQPMTARKRRRWYIAALLPPVGKITYRRAPARDRDSSRW